MNDPTPLQSNSWIFFVPYNQSLSSGWNAANIERLLNQHGVNTWGGQLPNGEYLFSVNPDQAQWTEYLLQRNGVPLTELSMGAPQPKPKPKHQQRSGDDLYSSLDKLLDNLLDRL